LIPGESLRAWKFLLLALNEAYDRRSVDLLLTLDKLGKMLCSGDGVVNFAPLIASQLVSCSGGGQVTPLDLTKYAYYLSLSEKGIAFVSAWKAGDQKTAVSSLRGETEVNA